MLQTALDAARANLADLLPAAVTFGLLALIIKRRAALAGLRQARAEITTNLALLLLNGVLIVPLLALPIATGRSMIPRPEVLVTFWSGVPDILAVLAAILLIDLAAYWRHRIEHCRALWPIHATHHADEAMNWLSLRRKHPLGEALSMLCDAVIVLLLGLPYGAIAVAFLVRAWWGYFIHADVPWTLGPLGKVLISPAAHRLHHIRDEALMGANYGNTVTLWDKLFGTYVDPAPYLGCETGIAEGTRDFWGELARPFEARYWKGSAQAAAEPAE